MIGFDDLPVDRFNQIVGFLPTYSLIGKHSIHTVSKKWDRQLKQNPFLVGKSIDDLITTCKNSDDVLAVLSDEILFENLSYVNLLKLLSKSPEFIDLLLVTLPKKLLIFWGCYSENVARRIVTLPLCITVLTEDIFQIIGAHNDFAEEVLANPEQFLRSLIRLESFYPSSSQEFSRVELLKMCKSLPFAMKVSRIPALVSMLNSNDLIEIALRHVELAFWVLERLHAQRLFPIDVYADKFCKRYAHNKTFARKMWEQSLFVLRHESKQLLVSYHPELAMSAQEVTKFLEMNAKKDSDVNNTAKFEATNPEQVLSMGKKITLPVDQTSLAALLPYYIKLLNDPKFVTIFDESRLCKIAKFSREAGICILKNQSFAKLLSNRSLLELGMHSMAFAKEIIASKHLASKLTVNDFASIISNYPAFIIDDNLRLKLLGSEESANYDLTQQSRILKVILGLAQTLSQDSKVLEAVEDIARLQLGQR